jgi:hypothetical protein
MFLPNSNSFSLVKSKILKPVIQSGAFSIEESETSLSRFPRIKDPDSLSGPSSATSEDSGKSTIRNKDKRTFLKVAGIAGASLAGSLLLPKKAEALKMTTVGSVDYIGEAAVGTAASAALWRAKKVDSTTGIIITWADGNANFDNSATDLTTLTYS